MKSNYSKYNHTAFVDFIYLLDCFDSFGSLISLLDYFVTYFEEPAVPSSLQKLLK